MRFLMGVKVRSDLAVVAVLMATIMLMVIPLPTLVVDVLLAFNIGLSVLLLLTAFYLHTPVQFSTLPSVILIATVFRLSLSIAVTRLVLVQADAGGIIRTFGDFVVAGNVVVGLVIFLIITVVQFIVITKGAERVAEVAARFTLDAMPGKQMAIDADLRSGDIDQAAARGRRRVLERESQLCGAMDGAMKFVKGDAIAGLVIIAVNLLGGLAIGVLQNGMSLGDAAHTYSILTSGDGLVAQVPALFISIIAGTVVTRVGGGEGDSLGGEIAAQISKDSRALWLAAGMTGVMGFVPGFPTVVFLLIAAGLALLARAATRRDALAAVPVTPPAIPAPPSRLRLFLPSALHAAAGSQLAGLLSRHAAALSEDLGIAIPAAEIMLPGSPVPPREGTFRLELDGVPIAEGTVPAGHLLLADDADVADLAGVAARPGAPLPGRPDTLWAPMSERGRLEAAGLGFQGPAEAVAAVVPVVLRRHAGQLIGIQEARAMLASAEASWGDLVREAQRVLPLQRMADLFRRLLDDGSGLAQLRLQRPGQAVESLQPLADTSADPQSLRLYGTALAMSGKPDEAAAAYCRGLALAPANAALHGNLALAAAGRTEEAMTELDAAVAAPIPDPRQDANAVLVLALLGRDGEARTRAQDAKIGLLATEMLMDRAAQARQEPDAAGRSRALGLAAAAGPVKAGPEAP